MSAEQIVSKSRLTVRNIGGINQADVVFEPGVTVLAGRNATNRTSLLQALMAALGSDSVSIKADADEAEVELDLEGKTYTRTLKQQNGMTRGDGNPYLQDPTLAELFAFLLGSNRARQAVLTDADLREIIMDPVDTREIQEEIDQLLEDRRQVSKKLDELGSLKDRLPSLEEERQRLQDQIEDKRTELQEVEAEIDARDEDVGQSREEQAALEEKLETLREKRSTLEDVRYELDTEEDSLDTLRKEKQEVEQEYEELPDRPAGNLDEIESRIDELRAEKQELESELNELQSVISFNQERLDDADTDSFGLLQDEDESAEVTDELLPDKTINCWTCGSKVDATQVESTIQKLRELSQETFAEINDIEERLAELNEKQRERRDQQRRRERLERQKQKIADDIEETEGRLDTLKKRREKLRTEVEGIEEDVESLENDAYEEILDLHKEANQLEYDLGTLENDLERVEDNIISIEDRLDEETDLQARREAINSEIEELRMKVEQIEQQAIEEFNEHMETILELLEYNNLARIWLERTETEVREGRKKVSKSVFDLHIIRQTDSGTTYEDTVDHLSESEREVTGLIFALAGYLAHEVYDTVPFMLLDSLEAIDSNRIATLVEYFEGYSDYLVVALLPDDASAVAADQRIESI